MYSKTDRFILALALLIIGLVSSALHFPIAEVFLSLMVLFTPLWFLKFVREVYHVKTQAAYELKIAIKKAADEKKRKIIEDAAAKRLTPNAITKPKNQSNVTYRQRGPR